MLVDFILNECAPKIPTTALIMATTVSEVLHDMAGRRKELEEWDCGRMEIAVATSLTGRCSSILHTGSAFMNINFTDTIGHRRQVPKAGKRDDNNCFWLPREWSDDSENTRTMKVIPTFIVAASKAGCKISGGWEKKYNKIVFTCF